MSIYFDIKEVLEVSEITPENEPIIDLAKSYLTWIGSRLLLDCANIHEITLEVDKKKLSFTGKTITTDYHSIIRALNNVTSFSLTTDYYYEDVFSFDSMSNQDDDYGHFSISSYLENADEDESKHIFYTMYNKADTEETVGDLYAYGMKGDKYYKGIVEEHAISDLPSEGHWYAPLTAVTCELDKLDGLNVERITQIYHELSAMSYDDSINTYNNGLTFYINNFEAKSKDDLEKFIHLTSELIDLTDGECCINSELVGMSAGYPCILKIDVEIDDKYSLSLISVQ